MRLPAPAESDPAAASHTATTPDAAARSQLSATAAAADTATAPEPAARSQPSVTAAAADTAATPPDYEKAARAYVLRQLTARDRSRAELRTKLLERGIPAAVADEVLSDYERVGFVDDSRLAANVVSSVAMRPRSRMVVRRELAAKGVDPEVVEEATSGLDREAELAGALALARKRAPGLARVAPEVARRRLAGALARRGYPPEVVYTAVKQALDDQGMVDL